MVARSVIDELIELDAHEAEIVDGIVGIGAHEADTAYRLSNAQSAIFECSD
jgi:hypothetical protein